MNVAVERIEVARLTLQLAASASTQVRGYPDCTGMRNWMSYQTMDDLSYAGVAKYIRRLRKEVLHLEPLRTGRYGVL
jgi:hypothetical protein